MNWYVIDKEYINYLKKYDTFVPNIDYKNRMKCFLGIIITTNGIKYFAPLTSFKQKFNNMKNDIDFFKIEDKETKKIYGAIDLNNMVPVKSNNYTKLTYDNIEIFRDFKNNREKKSYWKLLQKELSLININKIVNNAEKLYNMKNSKPNNNISMRCCNFKLLEEKCIEYNSILI